MHFSVPVVTLFFLINDVFPSVWVFNSDLFILNRFMTFEHLYTSVAFIYNKTSVILGYRRYNSHFSYKSYDTAFILSKWKGLFNLHFLGFQNVFFSLSSAITFITRQGVRASVFTWFTTNLFKIYFEAFTNY